MASYTKVITFGEFEEIADKEMLIFPFGYENMPKSTLGIIINKMFYCIEFTEEAEKSLKVSLQNRICPICKEVMSERLEEIWGNALYSGVKPNIVGWDCECGISLDMHKR